MLGGASFRGSCGYSHGRLCSLVVVSGSIGLCKALVRGSAMAEKSSLPSDIGKYICHRCGLKMLHLLCNCDTMVPNSMVGVEIRHGYFFFVGKVKTAP